MCTEGVIVVLRHQVQYLYKRGQVYSHFMPVNGVGEEKVFDLLRDLPPGQPLPPIPFPLIVEDV
jgi:hypothetical protein